MKREVVFFGDSITWGYGTEVKWPQLLCEYLNLNERNKSIPGTVLQSTNNLWKNGQSRVGEIIESDPSIVCILYGSNDMRYKSDDFTIATYKIALRSVVQKIRSSLKQPVEIIIGSPPYMSPVVFKRHAPYDDASVEKQRQYSDATEEVASNLNCCWVDVYGAMLKNGSEQLIGSDGFHPNADGHRLIAEAFREIISI